MDDYARLSRTLESAQQPRALVLQPVSPPRALRASPAESCARLPAPPVDARTAHATLARLRALVNGVNGAAPLHLPSPSAPLPAAAPPSPPPPPPTALHQGIHAALSILPTFRDIDGVGERLHSAVALAGQCQAPPPPPPVVDTSIWGHALPDSTVPLPGLEGAWRTLDGSAAAAAELAAEARLEERLSRLYLQLRDAERGALEAAFQARAASSAGGSACAPSPAPSPAPAPRSPQPPTPAPLPSPGPSALARHPLPSPSSPALSIGEGALGASRGAITSPLAQQANDRRRAAGLLSAAPWRGARYGAWRPGSADWAAAAPTSQGAVLYYGSRGRGGGAAPLAHSTRSGSGRSPPPFK